MRGKLTTVQRKTYYGCSGHANGCKQTFPGKMLGKKHTDYGHTNVPLLPCFLPAIAARLTTRCQ